MVSYVPHLSIDESLFALFSRIDQFGVLKPETSFYLFNTCHQKSVHFAVCYVGKNLPERDIN